MIAMKGMGTTGRVFIGPVQAPAAKQDFEVFDVWFSRSRGMLHFIACRVLGGSEHAERAIRNCWLSASRNSPKFDHEGEFRSWLLRLLMSEALAILHKRDHARRTKHAEAKPVIFPVHED
jgi:DNA-directed RNA polymerase specialized sigma24 family protein